MPPPPLPIEDLPIWARLNNVTFTDIKITTSPTKGNGIIAQRPLRTPSAPLLTVPSGLILNQSAVQEYAKEDRNFRLLYDAVDRKAPRPSTLLFLLLQASPNPHPCIPTPWTEYLRFLPQTYPLPTLWTEPERLLLRGTSLEPAVTAKLLALDAEFNHIYDVSSTLPVWNEALWMPPHPVGHLDYIRLDALYRSRCLELPRGGESLVPCVDMLNHAGGAGANAWYDEGEEGVEVRLREGSEVEEGDEVTISYGEDKSAAEMVFSYGFVERESAGRKLVLEVQPMGDDPLGRAKVVAYGETPRMVVRKKEGEGEYVCEAPFVGLMCVNEEDGLEFGVLQDTEGGRELRVFWRGEDVTGRVKEWDQVVKGCEMDGVFRLRGVMVMMERLQEQLELAREYDEVDDGEVRPEVRETVKVLREIEMEVLEGAIEALDIERSSLLEDKNVVAYLGSTETAGSDLVGDETSNEVEDFS